MSGGADSLALAALAGDWARRRGGLARGLIVDHGLRAASAAEAAQAAAQLARLGISATILPLEGLAHGPGLAARARAARYRALLDACAAAGILHLLIGHHRADQAETVTMRRLGGSGAAGLAGMAALVETAQTRLLRPLLDLPPGRLRATLRVRDIPWVEDPSNSDPASLRARLRIEAADPDGAGPEIAASAAAAAAAGMERAAAERAAAAWLAHHAEIRPEGYALVAAGPWHPIATGALLRLIAGAERAPSSRAVARLAAAPRACTLGGVRIMPAGRWRPGGWLLCREAAAIDDTRFRVFGATRPRGRLPAAVQRTLPAPRAVAGPPEGPDAPPRQQVSTAMGFVFAPPVPAACAPFAPMQAGC